MSSNKWAYELGDRVYHVAMAEDPVIGVVAALVEHIGGARTYLVSWGNLDRTEHTALELTRNKPVPWAGGD